MRWAIRHTTRFSYAAPVRDSVNEVRLRPFNGDQQTVESFSLRVSPAVPIRQYNDFYSNAVHHFDVTEPHSELLVESNLQVTTHARAVPSSTDTPAPMTSLNEALKVGRCHDFIQASRFVDVEPDTWRLAVDAVQDEPDTWQAALRLMSFVHGHLTYQSQSTGVHTHMRDVLAQRRGVCQDYAHVMLGLCRTQRIPALYVSGYLADESSSATHAWIEVHIPGIGWQPLDPTHNRVVDESYVKIGVGRDYGDVAPVKGIYRGTTRRTMEVQVQVWRA